MGIPVPPVEGIEGEPRPDSHRAIDLGTGESSIAHSVRIWSVVGYRKLGYCGYGRPGARYSRCLYGLRPGIYGYDRYGSCCYW